MICYLPGLKKGGGGRGRKEENKDVIEIATPITSLPAIFADFVSSDIKAFHSGIC